jgi:hypothetical protein|nr:MAG TPA: hypothetical protein [Bacteriophage sp.]
MVTQYFTTDVITAEEYVGYVRTIFQLQSAINIVGLDGGIQVVNNKLRFYNAEDEDITPEHKDLNKLGVDINLLVKFSRTISECIVRLDTTVQELYNTVCHAVVNDYGNIARYYRSNEDKNLVPSFVYLREFDNQDESDKVKLLYEYQYLYDYINNLCNMNTNRGMDDTIMIQYDVDMGCVNFVIEHTSVDEVTPCTIVRDNIAIRLLPTVVFGGSRVVKIVDVLNNIDTVIRYLIRLYADSFRVAYHGLKSKLSTSDLNRMVLKQINYITEDEGLVVFGDNVYSLYVGSSRVKHLVNQLDYVNKVECFIKAIEGHQYLLNTPIIDNYVTVASAIQSYLQYQYESVVGYSGYTKYMPYVCLLLSATSVSSVGYEHIHQSVNMHLIHYHSFMVDTGTSDRLDMLLSYIDFCNDNYHSDFTWFNENHTITVHHKHKEDEVLSLHKYIDDNSIGIRLDVDDVLDLLKLSRGLVKSFYNTLNADKDVVFIDALNGFRMISDIAKSKDDTYITLDYEIDKYLNCNTNYMGTINSDSLLTCSDMVFPLNSKHYYVSKLDNYKPLASIVEKRYKGMEVVLRLVTDMLFVIFDDINAKDIKIVSIGVEDFKDYSKLSFIVKTYDGRVETYPLLINDTFSYAVYSLFHEDSGYQIYDATLKEVYDILSEVRDMMVSSFNFIDFDEDIFIVVDNLRKLSVIVNSCDKKEGEKMKVVHTKETKLVRSSESRNLMLAKDLAIEFIDSGYDVIMRDGEDLVVYSNTDTSMQEYVPKSLHKVFYDVDKLDLLPLSYYVYMCK